MSRVLNGLVIFYPNVLAKVTCVHKIGEFAFDLKEPAKIRLDDDEHVMLFHFSGPVRNLTKKGTNYNSEWIN